MFKRLHVLFLLISLTSFVVACGESNTGEFRGSAITGTEEGGTDSDNNKVPGTGGGTIGGTTGDGNHNGSEAIPPVAGNAPDDQTPDSNINNDFSNPLNLVGRYKITALKIDGPKGALELLNVKDEVRGAFAVNPKVSASVSIDMGIKFQFNPEIVTKYGLEEQEIIYVNKKFNKPIDMSNGLDFGKIFADLGAIIEGKVVYFTLKKPDMPVGEGYSVIITLEKVSNTANFKLVNDPRKYWVTGNEPEAPIEPEEPEITEPEIPVIPDVPTDEVITDININNPATLTGNYQFTRFITVAAGVTVDSASLPRMQGHVSLNFTGSNMEATSKMQMEADVMGMTDNDKYNYTVYEPFITQGNRLTSTTSDPYKYSSAVITQLDEKRIQITQKLKKNAPFIGVTDVEVTVTAHKVSNQPKEIVDCGYWTTDTVKQCNEDGSVAMKNIDFNDPSTLIGNYKLVNYGMQYQRPAGGQYEKIWAEVRIFDGVLYTGKLLVDKWAGDVSIKETATGQALDFKVQVEAPYQVQDAFLFGDFKDPRWRFSRETDVANYTVEATPNKNELKIKVTRTFYYKYWWTEYPVNVDIYFIAVKQSDTPVMIDNNKFWETSEPTTDISIPDINNPRTITGHYRFTDMGHEYQRPGGSYEKNWASNGTAISKMEGEMWIKTTDQNGELINGNLKNATVNAKYQLNSWLYDGYDDGMLIGTRFDSQFKFYHEEFNDSYLIEMDPKQASNIKVCRELKLEYKWKSWGKWKTAYPTVYTCFIGEKISNNPNNITDSRYW